MSDNPFTKKPIEQIHELLIDIREDMDDMKKDISHIRDYIKKDMIKKQIEQEELIKQENEYVHQSKSWWFS